MSLDLNLLKALSDGGIHSGGELGERTGVSRAAIWKQLQKLQDLTGLEFESIKGRGYRLVGGIELLDEVAINTSVLPSARPLLSSIEVHTQVDSTNRQALLRAQEGARSGHAVLAEHQLAGRGRRGRVWVSPFASNLYLSVVWGFDSGAGALEGLSLVVGVAIARALSTMGVVDVGLKWPNDVYWQGRKLGGILLEMVGDAAGHCQVVVGVGINVNMPRQAEQQIDQPWCDLSTICGHKVSRNQLASEVLSHLLPVLSQFERDGFSAFRAEWSALDCIVGRPVVLHMGERMLLGTAAGVGDTGALAIDTDSGRQWFHGGEVSVRLQ